MAKVAVIGTGLVGSSIGLGLKRAGVRNLELVGFDKEPGNAAKARRIGAVDRTSWSLLDAVSDAALVVIATPVLAIRDTLQAIGEHLSEGAVVTDTGGTKAAVLAWAEQYLRSGVHFVGGHPLVYKEGSGPEAAEASLFDGRTYCIIPGQGASNEAVQTVVNLVGTLGARPYFIGAGEHDSFVAAVDHLPVLLSLSLMEITSTSPSWGDIAQLAGQPFRDASRLASLEPDLSSDVCLTNAEGLVHWVDACIKELYHLRKLLQATDREALHAAFSRAWEERERWLAGRVQAGPPASRPEIPGMAERFGELLVGRKFMEMQKRMMDDMAARERGGRNRGEKKGR